jgi:hypothetical protein
MILGKINGPFAKDLRDGPFTTLDTIRNAHPSVAPTGEGDARNLGTVIFNQGNTLKVSKRVLWHPQVPPENAGKKWFCKRVEAEDVLKLGEYRLNEFIV